MVLSLIPFVNLALLPLDYLYTYFHELGHVFAAVLLGAKVHFVKVFADGSGVTVSSGAVPIVVAPAGYVGAAIMSALLILAGKTPKKARTAISIMIFVLGFSLLALVRGDIVGVIAGIFWLVAMILIAKKSSDEHAAFFVQFIGISMAASSMKAVWDLAGLVGRREGVNDAIILEQATGFPAMASTTLWILMSLTAVLWALKRSWSKT